MIRTTRQANQAQGSWVIALENGMRMCLPFSCGVEVEVGSEKEVRELGDNERWVALPHLQALARLVAKLKPAARGAPDDTASPQAAGEDQPAAVAADLQNAKTTIAPDTEPDDQLPGTQPAGGAP